MKLIDAAVFSLAAGLTAFTIWLFGADYPREFVTAPKSPPRATASIVPRAVQARTAPRARATSSAPRRAAPTPPSRVAPATRRVR